MQTEACATEPTQVVGSIHSKLVSARVAILTEILLGFFQSLQQIFMTAPSDSLITNHFA